MKRFGRITACTAVLFLVFASMLAWTGGQAAWAATIPWSSTGPVGYSTVYSLAWNGTTLYAGCDDGLVFS